MKTYIERRDRALGGFAGGAAVIPAAHVRARNSDTDYEFHQDSDFYYLTGFDEPDALLVLAPEHGEHRCVLFVRERDRALEIWTGRRLGVERAADSLGVDVAYSIDELDARLPHYLSGAATLWYELGRDEALDRDIQTALTTARSKTRKRGTAPTAIAQPAAVLHSLRACKSTEEIETLRRAAALTARGHLAGMRMTRPGLFEYEIEATIEYEYRRGGAQREAYESIVASGDNATILHYSSNRHRLIEGELLLVDSGCELDYYASDVTRTWPINGRFSPEQRAIYEIVLAAQAAAIAEVRPGNAQSAFHQAAVRTITEGLLDIALLSGTVDENIELERYRDYFMHGTGHWMGLDVHDVGRYRDESDGPIRFEPGMVTTIEPGIYVNRDLSCDERFKGIGVRIEDDLLVTSDGYENLTTAIPKSIEELEEIVSGARRALG